MADTKKIKVRVKQPDGSYLTLHPETQSDITNYEGNIAGENVKEALENLNKKVDTIPDSFVASVNGIDGKVQLISEDESISINNSANKINLKANLDKIAGLAKVAETGRYEDLVTKPFTSINQEDFSINEGELELDDNVRRKINKVPTLESTLITAQTHILENKEEIDQVKASVTNKQEKLIAGSGINIAGNVISAENSGDYEKLTNKPKINKVELEGNLTTKDLHIHYEDLENLPEIPTDIVSSKELKQAIDDIKTVRVVDILPEIEKADKHSIYVVREAQPGHIGWNMSSEFIVTTDGDNVTKWEKLSDPNKQDKLTEINAGRNIEITEDENGNVIINATGGGSGGTGDYNELINRPQINGHLLTGNQSSAELGLVDKAVNDLENYYLKSETYTQEEVNNLIASIEKLSFKLVDELPETGESNIIYLVKNSKGNRDEYIYVDSKWDKIGSTDIDLSGYYTKEEADSKFLTEHQDISGKADKTYVDGEIDKVEALIPDVSGLATKEEVNSKQAKLTAGENITIENNVIKAKDTTYTAGNHISIIGNIISAEDQICKIGETFRTNVTVGNLKAGTEITAEMTIAEVLKMMLMRPTGILSMFTGAVTNIPPTTLNDLNAEEITAEELVKPEGLVRHINCGAGTEEDPLVQYQVCAVPIGYKVSHWKNAATDLEYTDIIKTVIEDYNVYYRTSEIYDADIGGEDLKFIIEEEA